MSDWKTRRLSEIAEIRVSNVDKKVRESESPVRLCNYMDVYLNNYITPELEFMESTANSVEKEKFKVSQGDVIITKDSETPYDIGIPAVVVDDIPELVCGYHLALIKPNHDEVNALYLSKQLASTSAVTYFSRMAAGSTRYGLSNGSIGAVKIPVAPIGQQKIISNILFSIDKLIEKTEDLIAKYQQIKAGLMHDLFTRGVTADGKLRPPREQAPKFYKESPIGWIPNDWKWLSVNELCSHIVDCPHSTPDYLESGFPCIRTADMLPGQLLLDQAYKVSYRTYLDRNQRLTPKLGDIIYSREGERLGIASPVGNDKVCMAQRVMLLRPRPTTDPDFLMWSMNLPSFYRRVIRGLGATTSPHVNVGDVKAILTVCPPEIEQQHIGNSLKKMQIKLLAEEANLKKLMDQKSGLMQDLLTGKVQVKVDHQETVHV